MKKNSLLYHGTNIDGVKLRPESLFIRGEKLTELVGKVNYVEAIYKLISGRHPSALEQDTLNEYLIYCVKSAVKHTSIFEAAYMAKTNNALPYACIAVGLLNCTGSIAKNIIGDFDFAKLNLTMEEVEGLFYFSITYLFLALATTCLELSAFLQYVNNLKTVNYIDLIYKLISDHEEQLNSEKKPIFNDILIALQAGLGILPPTILMPRISAGTHTPLQYALASGFLAAGPAHVGACENVMKIFTSLASHYDKCKVKGEIDKLCREYNENKLRIPGYGHPIFKKDPRNKCLRDRLTYLNIYSNYIEIYDVFSKSIFRKYKLRPNIDSICGTILLLLDIEPNKSTGLFLCARAASMLAHILERKNKPPFGLKSVTAREYLRHFSIGWL